MSDIRPLIDREVFAPIFRPLVGQRVGLCLPIGNVGDDLIAEATRQLLKHFGVDNWRYVDYRKADVSQLDVLLWGGGGNMGRLWGQHYTRAAILGKAKAARMQTVCLPQSYAPEQHTPEFDIAYVRDKLSHRLCPWARLAPDLALTYVPTGELPAATKKVGIFIRLDKESAHGPRPQDGNQKGGPPPGPARYDGDPIWMCKTPLEYVQLASQHEHVYTDRLHFAIGALIAGRRATLLPNSYHKNRGMYETWLADLGCQWLDSHAKLADVRRD